MFLKFLTRDYCDICEDDLLGWHILIRSTSIMLVLPTIGIGFGLNNQTPCKSRTSLSITSGSI